MQWLLRYNFWLVKLAGVATVAALAANTASTGLALYVVSSASTAAAAEDPSDADDADDEDEGAIAATTAPRSDDRARRAERLSQRILGYNAFCPGCEPAPSSPAGPGVEPGTDQPLSGARRSQLPLAVAATMESDDPALSIATLVDTERGIGGLFGVGDHLGPQVEIIHVATGVVHIRNAGQLEYIPFDALPAPAKAKTKPKTKPARKPKPPAIPGAEESIKCTGKGDCVVERQFVEELIANPKLLAGQLGASPTTTKDGSPGFRLRGIKKGTLLNLLGLKTGDVITEIGGTPLTLDVLPGLYGKLRHASHLEVTIDRRGKRQTRQLQIRS